MPLADRSIRRQAINPRKLHPVDWALGYPFVPEQKIDVGHRLETAVFLHWRRQRKDLGYLSDDKEIDLVIGIDKPESLINVAQSVTEHRTWEREISALQSIGASHPDAARVLVVGDAAGRQPPAGIDLVEAWQYLIQPNSSAGRPGLPSP